MKTRSLLLSALAAVCLLAGCASDRELTQKEKDKIDREQAREAQKQQKAQDKMMRDSGAYGGQRRMR